MGQFGIGQPVRRREDARLLTGLGIFVDDRKPDALLHAVLLRSPHPHAIIEAVDTQEAADMPGVQLVATHAELAADGIGPLPVLYKPSLPDGAPFLQSPRPLLARGRVRHVGEPVALVVADSLASAQDAAERIAVRYRPLPAVADATAARRAGAPRVSDDAPENLSYTYELGDRAATDAAFAKAHRTVRATLVNNRVVINAIEPRAALGLYDTEAGRFTLHTNSQVPHRFKGALAEHVLHVPAERIRVVIGDVGGGFGAKNQLYAEQPPVLWAARRLGRPVKWIGTNGEGFLTDIQGRDNRTEAELALDAEGRFLALRARTVASLGAYLSNNGALIPTAGLYSLAGVYRMPAVHVRVEAAFAHTTRTDAYRGAGRPEANYVIERLVDRAAREMDLMPDELRRRNMLTPVELPHKTPLGTTYDSGDFPRLMDEAKRRADWGGFPARRADAARRGKLRGIGLASVIERSGGGGFEEASEILFAPDGTVAVLSGMMANGQGHETSFAQIVADKLGVPYSKVRIVQGDTDVVKTGWGTAGSRSLVLGGGSLVRAIERAVANGRDVAAHLLETATADLEFRDGAYRIAGTDRSVAFEAVMRAVFDPKSGAPATVLDARESFKAEFSFPNGCHIAEVEIDPDTGRAVLAAYAMTQDSGTILNPMIVHGQLHGGLAQGIGQALLERVVTDAETAQPLSASLMDYALPRADDLPSFAIELAGIPTRGNPLGVKGCGECGCSGAPPAVMNAVTDALWSAGVRQLDMPATPEEIWRALRRAAQDKAA